MEQRALVEEQYLPGAETWAATLSDQPAGFISLLETFIGGWSGGKVAARPTLMSSQVTKPSA